MELKTKLKKSIQGKKPEDTRGGFKKKKKKTKNKYKTPINIKNLFFRKIVAKKNDLINEKTKYKVRLEQQK